jgi:hypothetical protein
MIPRDTLSLAAELRACAERASDQERADLLVLIAGYEALAQPDDGGGQHDPAG